MDFKYLKDENNARIYPVTHSNGVVSGKHSDKTLTQELDNYVLVEGSKNLLNPTMSTATQAGITCTNNGDGTYTLNGTASSTATFDIYSFASTEWNSLVAKGVKLVGCPSGGSLDTYVLYTNGSFGNANFCTNTNGVAISATQSTSNVKVRIQVSSGQVCNNIIFRPMITMDTSATYNDYQPYFKSNKALTEQVSSVASGMAEIAGIVTTDHLTLTNTASSLSLNGYGTESGGSNIWDEKWESGQYNTSSGIKQDNATSIRSSGTIPCESSTQYRFIWGSSSGAYKNQILFYDASGNYIEGQNKSFASYPSNFTTPSNAKSMAFFVASTTTYNNDIAIIEGTSGSYSPYFASNKSLTDRIDRDFELERFGYVCPIINGVRNFVDSNGVLHRRIARVDLSTLGTFYAYQRDVEPFYYINSVLQGAKSTSNVYDSSGKVVALTIASSSTRFIYPNGSDLSAIGVPSGYLYFELATEETYSAYDTPSVQSMISDEWDSTKTYTVGEYAIYQGSLYKSLIGSRGAWPASNPTYWQKCKVTDVDRVALQSSTQTSFAELAGSVPEGYKYSMQLNITNFTDKPSGITSWFAYCDISASNMSGFVSLILTSNQGMWYGKYGSGTVTWTKVVD